MRLNRTPDPLDRSARNDENENWDILEGETSKLNSKVDDFITGISNEAFQQVIDNIKMMWREPVDSVSDLPSDNPSGTVRMVRDTGKIYRFQDGKWDEIQDIDPSAINELDNRLTSQLADTTNRLTFGNLMQHKLPSIKIITIIDDDGRNELYDMLYPTLKGLGIKFTSAVVTSRIDRLENTITSGQYREMLNSGYVEFISHTHTHKHLAQLTEPEIIEELVESRNWLIKNGGNPDYLVYPFNSRNDLVYKLTREYYKGAFSTNGVFNKPPLNSMLIGRHDFDNPINIIKSYIDTLDSEGGWMVLNSHAFHQYMTPEFVEDIVQYALDKGDIKFMTVGEAMQHYGNIVDLDERNVIGADGKGTGMFDKAYDIISGQVSGVADNTPITDFEVNKITSMYFIRAVANDRGFPGAGIYTVDRRANDDFGRSFFYPYKSVNYYVRFWDRDNNVWGSWRYIEIDKLDNKITNNAVGFNTRPDDMSEFQRNNVFTTKITESVAGNFPESKAGLLTVDVRGGNGYQFQDYRPTFSNKVYRRHWRVSDGGFWTAFE